MHIRLKREPGLYLTGFMGCGKTTVARKVADRLGWDFVDLDAEIEKVEATSISAIFASRGEAEFRRIEHETLRKLVRKIGFGMPAVVALGGGAFVQPANLSVFDNHGITVWLDCSFETVQKRIAGAELEAGVRPLARDPEAFRTLYENRREGYGRALYRVDAEGGIDEAVEQILALPCWK